MQKSAGQALQVYRQAKIPKVGRSLTRVSMVETLVMVESAGDGSGRAHERPHGTLQVWVRNFILNVRGSNGSILRGKV